MVTVVKTPSLKYKVNAKDHNPPHVHVEGMGCSVRINLLTLEPMDDHTDFGAATLARIIQMVELRREELLKKWSEYHGQDD